MPLMEGHPPMSTVDTHAHFWDVERLDYPWIEAESPFDRSFHLEDYQRASAEVPVKRMVFVECDAHPRCSVGSRMGGRARGPRSAHPGDRRAGAVRSEEHTSELQSLMRISYAVFCLKKK